MDALRYFYRVQGEGLWGIYGFKDAFNLTRNWFANSYIAIDQGPIICMIENHRSGLLWDYFMTSPEIAPALEALGFEADDTSVGTPRLAAQQFSVPPSLFPNPRYSQTPQLVFDLRKQGTLSIELLDWTGRRIQQLRPKTTYPAGEHQLALELPYLPAGNYAILLQTTLGPTVLPLTQF